MRNVEINQEFFQFCSGKSHNKAVDILQLQMKGPPGKRGN